VTLDPGSIDPVLLEVIVCPRCHARLQAMPGGPEVGEKAHLACTNDECGLRFPVRDGVPILLIDEATRAD
jgi:uncharacterized protein YbaR (Trm112 family)